MGFSIDCKGAMYSCGYSNWVNLREEVANASILYLRCQYDILLQNSTNDSFSYLENQLSQIFEYIEVNNCATVPDFMYLFANPDFLNTFIYYNLGGVYALLNKSDDDGYYSVGNSYDILDALTRIETHLVDDNIKNSVQTMKKVFDNSVQHKQIVSIY